MITLNNVDWKEIIDNLPTSGKSITANPNMWNSNNIEYKKIFSLWTDAGFNLNSVKWENFYPGADFDKKISENIAKELNLKELRSWISKLEPGYCAPWHWDIDDCEAEYLTQGTPKRYSCFINEPVKGQILILGDDYYFNQPVGTIIEWDHYHQWHSATNVSMEANFMFHILGIPND